MAEAAERAEGKEAAKRAPIVNLPVRVSPATHDALRRIAYEQRRSIHSLLLDGIAEVLRQHGK